MDPTIRAELIKVSNYFGEKSWPYLKCPYCKMGQLIASDVNKVETEESKASRNNRDWDPMRIDGLFTATLTCSNCKSVMFVQGKYGVDIVDYNGEHQYQYDDCLKIKYLSKPLDIMVFPSRCPQAIKNRIEEVSDVLWINPDAATNRLRIAIDDLLSALKIPRNYKNKKSQWERYSTHARIILLKNKHKEAAGLLEAVKWIGNDGSHDDGLKVSEVLDGIELYNRALNLIYDNKDKLLNKKAKLINARKGIKPKSRR